MYSAPLVVPLIINVEKCGTVRQATDDNVEQRVRIACWITKATGTHSEYVKPIAFPRQRWIREAPQCYVYTYVVSLVTVRDGI